MQPTPTRVPTWCRVTADPTSVTTPTISWPGTTGKGCRPQSPLTVWMSEWQMPAYSMLMSTSFGPTSRRSMVTGASGWPAAGDQIELLAAQEQRLAHEAEQIVLRQKYVRLKIDYWQAVEAGDNARAELVSGEARALADQLKRVREH